MTRLKHAGEKLPHFTTTLPREVIDSLREMAERQGLSIGQLIAKLVRDEQRRELRRKP